jgi:hypothetical protein
MYLHSQSITLALHSDENSRITRMEDTCMDFGGERLPTPPPPSPAPTLTNIKDFKC